MIRESLKRWLNILSFVVAYLSLGFIGWAAHANIRQPYDGLDWMILSGQVIDVDPEGPAHQVLYPGDVILAVDDVPPAQALPLYHGFQVDKPVQFTVERRGKNLLVEIEFSTAPIYILRQ
jgi:hypothetical protein